MRKMVTSLQSPEPQESDVRLKQDVDAVGSLAEGLPLYSFKYLWDDTEYVGVMAQDVLEVCPDAVLLGEDGYYRVDYAMLGTQMMTRAEWDGLQLPGGVLAASATSPEPKPESDIRLKRDIVRVGKLSPEPKPSDLRLKRDVLQLGHLHLPR
jgi:hypothetical protein